MYRHEGKVILTWDDIEHDIKRLGSLIKDDDKHKDLHIMAVNRGGNIPATILSHYLGCPIVGFINIRREDTVPRILIPDGIISNICIVDDILDTGDTFQKIINAGFQNAKFFVPYAKKSGYLRYKSRLLEEPMFQFPDDIWVVYPWEEWKH